MKFTMIKGSFAAVAETTQDVITLTQLATNGAQNGEQRVLTPAKRNIKLVRWTDEELAILDAGIKRIQPPVSASPSLVLKNLAKALPKHTENALSTRFYKRKKELKKKGYLNA